MDAIDAALVGFSSNKTLLIDTLALPMPSDLRFALNKLITQQDISLRLLGETDTQLAKLFAQVSLDLLKKANFSATQVSAIGSHGQTLYHSPQGKHPFTLQIGDPNIIAAQTGIKTISDFRRRDVALGGQGAPLVPAFHAHLFPPNDIDQWVLNLGGIANLTYLPSKQTDAAIMGFDTGPGNTLLDQWCEKHRRQAYDHDGEWAKTGRCNENLLEVLCDDPYFNASHPKSTGREYFNLIWLEKKLTAFSLAAADIQNTLIELTASSVAEAIKKISPHTGTLWVCGGGAYNGYLLTRLQTHCKQCIIKTTNDIGIAPKWMEAAAFAWLAKQTLAKKPGNMPSVTGARTKSILGAVYYTLRE